MSETPAVRVEGVTFGYDDRVVLEDVNVTVQRGEFLAIVGPNGGGKTTFLKLLLGLLQPIRGRIEVFGERPARVLRRLGYVPQVFQYDSAFPVTVSDVVRMGLLGVSGCHGTEGRRVEAALERVGLGALVRRPVAQLSGGQRQRVLIARALVAEPDMLLLDEPTASVDGLVRQGIYELLAELNKQMTVLVVTHNLAFVSNLVRDVLCVNRRVLRHPTVDLTHATGEFLQAMYGPDLRLVQHNAHGDECLDCAADVAREAAESD